MPNPRTPRSPIRHTSLEARLAAVAARQHDLVTVAQAAEAGLGERAVQRRAASGRWRRVHRGVYTVSHAPLTEDARRLAAVLASGIGAVLSHRSAAALWEILDDRPLLHVTTLAVDGGRTGPPAIRLHRSRRLELLDHAAIRGIPVTSLPRTLIDVAATEPDRVMRHAVHEAEVRRLLVPDEVRAVVERTPGRRGSRRLLMALGVPAADPTNSVFVKAFMRLCDRHRLPRPETTVYVDAGFDHKTELDLLYSGAKLIVELDGEQTHRTRRRFHHDRRRDAALAARGYLTLRYTWHRVTRECAEVADEVRAVLSLRGGVPNRRL